MTNDCSVAIPLAQISSIDMADNTNDANGNIAIHLKNGHCIYVALDFAVIFVLSGKEPELLIEI